MYAVIKTGGKQLRVAPGEKVKVEKLAGKVGDKIRLSELLLLHDGKEVKLGDAISSDAHVAATILDQGRDDKILVFKMKRRKHFRKRNGYRHSYTRLSIDEIVLEKAERKKSAKKEKERE